MPGLQLDRVHRGAGGNVPERQRVADQNVGLGARADRRAHLQPNRLQDVALLAVRVMHQRNARRAAWIVLDRRHFARHSELLALEIDEAQLLLVAAAVVADGQVARVAASAGALADRQQRLVRRIRRQVVVDQRGLKPQRRRYRSVCLDWHRLCPGVPAAQPQPRSPRFSRSPFNRFRAPIVLLELSAIYCCCQPPYRLLTYSGSFSPAFSFT